MKRFAFAAILLGLCWCSTANAQVYFQLGTYNPIRPYIAPGVPISPVWNGSWSNYYYRYPPYYGGFYNYGYNYRYYNYPSYYPTYRYNTWPRYNYGRGWHR